MPINPIADLAGRLTPLRKSALFEIAAAGERGLGFSKCSLQKRRELLKMGLIERLSAESFFQPVRERLTPLGLAVKHLLEQGEGK